MTNLISRIFTEIPFTGTCKKQCLDETFRDQGKLPLFPPEIHLEYEFEFCRLLVDTSRCRNEVEASSSWKSPEKYFYDQRMDELYLRILSELEQAKQKLIKDPHIIDCYPRIVTGISGRFRFNRMALMVIDPEEQPFSGLEQKLRESFGVSKVEIPVENYKKIKLKNKVSLELDNRILPNVAIFVPFNVPEEVYKQVRDFLFEQLKSKNPRIDTSNHHVYFCQWIFQHEQGHYLIEEVFQKDIEQLPKQEPRF